MNNLVSLAPLVLFLVAAFALSFFARSKAKQQNEGFLKEYFIGNRTLGGFVLAMTTIATYGSVSSFVGGPGQAWLVGFGWVYMAVVQVTALILLYGIFGKKLALISRKLDAVTVIDVIRARYNSNALAVVCAVIIVVFFGATMVAQFVGGAKLFEAVTGYSYNFGLVLFGIAVIIFTTIGGFRGVALTDTLCGIVMLIGIAVLAAGIINAGGGYENIMATIQANHPEMFDPFAQGQMPAGLYFTQWLLVGVLTFVLPQSMVRCMGFRDTGALRGALVVGTIIIGIMMLGTTVLGVLSAGVLTGSLQDYGSSVDNIIPLAIVQTLPPVVSGIAIVGPIAASISTVSSLLIFASSAIIKDIYIHAATKRKREVKERHIALSSQAVTLVIGVIVFVLSVVPPSVIWKINMFAFGGLETAFFWVMVCGLFWKRATKAGALCSMVGGTVAYCVSMALGFKIAGLHQIVIGIFVAGVCMLVASLAQKQTKAEKAMLDEVFFPQ